MSTANLDFIVIDNNSLNCFIAERMLQNIDRSIGIRTFVHAMEAFEYIAQQPVRTDGGRSVILLDIHMPLMDGFEFARTFEEKIPADKRDQYVIYILTSSTDMNDKLRSRAFPSVRRFLSKPLTFNILTEIIGELGGVTLASN